MDGTVKILFLDGLWRMRGEFEKFERPNCSRLPSCAVSEDFLLSGFVNY